MQPDKPEIPKPVKNKIQDLKDFINHIKAYKGCKRISIPPEACRINFTIAGEHETKERLIIPNKTIREEQLILNLDEKKQIINIELYGQNKPCQGYHK